MVTQYGRFGNLAFGFVAKSAFHRRLIGIKQREGDVFKLNLKILG